MGKPRKRSALQEVIEELTYFYRLTMLAGFGACSYTALKEQEYLMIQLSIVLFICLVVDFSLFRMNEKIDATVSTGKSL